MSFLRLGASCVVIDEQNRVLLSQRADLKTWTTPGGRLDRGETLVTCALRETREETGIIAAMLRPVGLYFRPGWGRLNALFLARRTGGALLSATYETLGNRFFPADDNPAQPYAAMRIAHALNGETVLQDIATEPRELARLKRKFALRYVQNLLAGRPEPRYPRLNVQAVAVVTDGQGRVLTSGGSHLPGVVCDGTVSPWAQMQRSLAARFDVDIPLVWRGLSEDPARGRVTFVFGSEQLIDDHAALVHVSRLQKRHKAIGIKALAAKMVFLMSDS